ncbi:hypothetical protein THF1C08_50100 [Vibrio jasicida]|uniref:Uncharacterized protein n=1 Tax=Vibrio jasicida TaxID=766224 RepID=A0AAU9QTR5_9VIBR|nr:hypothetical protein THF1C08_50100 [Vibrio jasicida]CAH1601833.1 hypothetical protein THF1A12_50247 [Vibrio jasicida]
MSKTGSECVVMAIKSDFNCYSLLLFVSRSTLIHYFIYKPALNNASTSGYVIVRYGLVRSTTLP